MRRDIRDRAVSLDLTGKVCNKLNHVEVIANGKEENINKLKRWLSSLKDETGKRKNRIVEIKTERGTIEEDVNSFSDKIIRLEGKLNGKEREKIKEGFNEDLAKEIKLLKLELKNLKLKQILRKQEQINGEKELKKLEIIRQEIWSIEPGKLTEEEGKEEYPLFDIIEDKTDKETDFQERIYQAADDLSAIRTSTIDYMNFDKISLDFAHLDVKYSAFSDTMGEFIDSQNNLITEMKKERRESEQTIKTLVEDIKKLVEMRRIDE